MLVWTMTRVGRHGRCIVGATVGMDGDALGQIKETYYSERYMEIFSV